MCELEFYVNPAWLSYSNKLEYLSRYFSFSNELRECNYTVFTHFNIYLNKIIQKLQRIR